ncbi:MAG: VanZ family protein [Bacteroidales bacterium]|nr:VanZ family protein [Bacteroidales bacterium]
MERLTRNSIPGILCGIIILILTGLPGSLFPRVKPAIGLDKVAHILMYAGFAYACLWGYRKQFVSNGLAYKKRAILLTVIISIAYGGLTEIMQETITLLRRSGDWRDLIADAIGTALGVLVFYLFFRRKK